MVTAKTGSRNAAFKAGKMSEAAFETQVAFVVPGVRGQLFSPEHESMDDVKRNT